MVKSFRCGNWNRQICESNERKPQQICNFNKNSFIQSNKLLFFTGLNKALFTTRAYIREKQKMLKVYFLMLQE